MAIKIGSNIESLKTQRRLGEATTSLSSIYERLSSGQRINKASDDAAGLAISEDLKVKSRIFSQAIRNGNDGASLLNIADSTVNALSNIVTRISELATQSSNGSYTNKQRSALDAEAQALSNEYSRIKNSATFNGIKLFDGSLGNGLNIQLGIGNEGVINSSIGGDIGTGTFGASTSISAPVNTVYSSVLGDVNGDGFLDLISGAANATSVRLGTSSGLSSYATVITDPSSTYGIALGDVNNDGFLDMLATGLGQVRVRIGNGNGTFGSYTTYSVSSGGTTSIAFGDLNGDGNIDIVTGGTASGAGYSSVLLGNGNGTFGSSLTYSAEGTNTSQVMLGDLNGDNILDLVTVGTGAGARATIRLGAGNGTFGTATSYLQVGTTGQGGALGDLNNDGILDLVTINGPGGSAATIRLGNGDGSFGTSTSIFTGNSAQKVNLSDINGDGILDLIAITRPVPYGRVITALGNGSGSFGAVTSYNLPNGGLYSGVYALSVGDISGDGVNDIIASGYSYDGSYYRGAAHVLIGNNQDGISPLLPFSLKSKADALQSIGLMKRAQENLSQQRGIIGASQSRIEIAISSLTSSKENFDIAESRIRDSDIATDAAELVRTQILQQASSAILAQANQIPALALKLLG